MNAAMPCASAPAPAPARLLADRNFRWLLGGGLVSMLGEQFTTIALPWLVLETTGDPMTLGAVLAIMSLPRAIFILVGGALVDRHSPRRVLLLTKSIDALLLAVLAFLVWHGALHTGMLYAIAAAIGLATAFSYPAASAILPRALPASTLQGANGVMMSLRQLTALVGPVIAGLLVGMSGAARAQGVADARGLTLAFSLDALSFAVSALALVPVKMPATSPVPPPTMSQAVPPASTDTPESVGTPMSDAIVEALRAFWNDRALRTLCLYFAAVGAFVGGPLQVALPVLAQRQLPGGAASLGLLLASHGGGVLAGMALSGLRPGWRLRTLGTTMLVVDGIAGLTLVAFGRIDATWQGLVLLGALGGFAGFIQVAALTWMQRRVAPEMLGRMMSLFLFIFLGLAPLSAAAAGAALRWVTPSTLFGACGLTLVGLATLGLAFTSIREIRDSPPTTSPDTRPVSA